MSELQRMSEEELQDLLMKETKMFTSGMRDGWSGEEREKIRYRIEEIQRLIESRSGTVAGHELDVKNIPPA
jgi:hypothetical protein